MALSLNLKLLPIMIIVVSSAFQSNLTSAASHQLTSVRIDQPIQVDGMQDTVWNTAPTLAVKVDRLPYKANNYEGIKETEVMIKSLYDKEFVYFFVQYQDPTKSLMRFPWVKQDDGSWKMLKDKDQTGHSNVYYEDKFAFFWEINTPGFAKKGCAISCHLLNDSGQINGIDQVGITAGRKYTRRAGQSIDMWHWKSVRMNPVGVIDDQFVDHVKDPKASKNWGRHGDNKTGGGYTTNINSAGDSPEYMNKQRDEFNQFTITPAQKTPFIDTFSAGDMIPGIQSTAFTGSRGDIAATGVWKEGVWSIEIKRKLVTTGKDANIQDVQFDDLSKSYNFGVAVFDNSQINHIYHDGALTFTFD